MYRLSSAKFSPMLLIGVFLFGIVGTLMGVFFITRDAAPYTSELSYIEHSSNVTKIGSVVPASCESNPITEHWAGDTAGCIYSCALPWGGSVAYGSQVTAYAAPSVVWPSTCQSQVRACGLYGALSGSYNYASCTISPATASIWVDQGNILTNSSTIINWSSTGATSCVGDGFATGGAIGGNVGTGILTTSPSVPNTSYAYRVTCSGPGGSSAPQQASVAVWNPADAGLTAASLIIPEDGSTSLLWTSANATACFPSGFAIGALPGGTVPVGPLSNDANYSIFCVNPVSQSPGRNVTIDVNKRPTVYAGIDRVITLPTSATTPAGATIFDPENDRLSISWTQTSTGMPTAEIGNGDTLNPSFRSLSAAGTYTFKLTISDGINTVDDSMNVTVLSENNSGMPPPTGRIRANGSTGSISIASGDNAVLTWTSNNTTDCRVFEGVTQIANAENNIGGLTRTPASDTVYALYCDGSDGVSNNVLIDLVSVAVGSLTLEPEIDADDRLVSIGDSTNLTWNTNGGLNCVITANGVNTGFDITTRTASPTITSRTTYTILCPDSGSDSVIIEIIPRGFET